MPDEPTLGELSRRLDRAEDACAKRAQDHVDKDLYTSERKTIRTEVARNSDRIADIRRDLEQQLATERREREKDRARADEAVRRLEKRITDSRRHAVMAAATIIIPVVVAAITVMLS